MGELSKNLGKTVVFVSHNMGAITTMCSHVILMNLGKISASGHTQNVIKNYLSENLEMNGKLLRSVQFSNAHKVFIDEIKIYNETGVNTGHIDSKQPFLIQLKIIANSYIDKLQLAIRVTNHEGIPVFTTTSTDEIETFTSLTQGIYIYKIHIPGAFLKPAEYSLIIAAFEPGNLFDSVEDKIGFVIEDLGNHSTILRDGRLGVITPILKWEKTKLN